LALLEPRIVPPTRATAIKIIAIVPSVLSICTPFEVCIQANSKDFVCQEAYMVHYGIGSEEEKLELDGRTGSCIWQVYDYKQLTERHELISK
jgi:hypothetical protein